MNHSCDGEYTTDVFDMLNPLVKWVENGHAPDSVLAQPIAPKSSELPTDATQALFSYPMYACYKCSGNVADAENLSYASR